MRAAWLVAAAVLAVPAIARAQEDVPALIKLLTDKPASMDTATWKEKRRDAAKRLAAAGDKRAVPALMKLAEDETFDIVGELAIDALGALGDPQAVPVLQRIEADPSRDRTQRDKARKALARLGAKPSDGAAPEHGATTTTTPTVATTATTTPTVTPTVTPTPTDSGSLGSVLLGNGAAAPVPAGPAFADDVLASIERLTFAVGNGHLSYDSVRKQTSFDADLSASYLRRVDTDTLAYTYGGAAHVLAGYLNPDGPASSRGAELELQARGDVRSYFGAGTYVGAQLEGTHQTTYVNNVIDNGTAARDVRFATELQLALGVGYGRVLDTGSLVRVRRVAAVLEQNRALGRPIDAATARRLQTAWWALRGSSSLHPVLLATVSILRETGVLLGEPDAGLTYELLEVLRDGQLDDRASGVDVSLRFGEGYLNREDDPMLDTGRVEQILFAAAYAKQLPGDTADLTATAFARLRVFTDMNAPNPYVAGANARWRRFFYGEHFDPSGALDLGATLGVSSDDRMGSTTGWLLGGDVGWTFRPNRSSSFRLGADAKLDAGQVFLGATLDVNYGLAPAGFVRM